MAVTLDIKYFNSFLVKKVKRDDTITGTDDRSDWIGLPWNPRLYPQFPVHADTSDDSNNWFVEESRIRGGFNNVETDYGVRAYLFDQDSDIEPVDYGIIYSGIYNPRTQINQSNVFSVAEDIEKAVDPRYGSIQKLFSDDSNLLILQENKVSRGLVDKDAIYSAVGSQTIVSSNAVIGDIQPYSGEYGIGKFPESFARKGYRTYMADVPNSCVLRLSRDGFNEISKSGMDDFFRDEFKRLSAERKRFPIDLSWTIPWSTATTTITVSGDNIGMIEYGMAIEGIEGFQNLHIVDIGTESGGEVEITLNREINVVVSPQPNVIQAVKYVKDNVIGGIDNYSDLYTLSIHYNEPIAEDTNSGVTVIPVEAVPNPNVVPE